MGSSRPHVPLFTAVLVLACAALGVLVVVLSRQNRELRAELAELTGAMERRRDVLKPGDRLAPLTAAGPDGREVRVPLDAPGRRLVMVGSVHCPACLNAKPYWAELGAAAVAANVSTICLMTDGAGTPEDEAALAMPVLGVRGFRESSIAKIPGMPMVLLVQDGVVQRLWPGPFDVQGAGEIRAAMGG